MKIILDSNIVFSAILNTESKIGNILFTSSNLKFYSSIQLQEEIIELSNKILK